MLLPARCWIATTAAQLTTGIFEPDAVELDHPATGYRITPRSDRVAQLNARLLGFAAAFTARGPRDSTGRSLRDLDLKQRLMRYPCSYMVYSAAFDGLPGDVREMVYRRMKRILAGEERAPRYAHIGSSGAAVIEILRETKKNLPPWF